MLYRHVADLVPYLPGPFSRPWLLHIFAVCLSKRSRGRTGFPLWPIEMLTGASVVWPRRCLAVRAGLSGQKETGIGPSLVYRPPMLG